jgi:hypothetical protein
VLASTTGIFDTCIRAGRGKLVMSFAFHCENCDHDWELTPAEFTALLANLPTYEQMMEAAREMRETLRRPRPLATHRHQRPRTRVAYFAAD